MKIQNMILLVLTIVSASCGNGSKKDGDGKTTDSGKIVMIPEFNADSAHTYVAKQVEFGSRVPGSEAHKACRDWLVAELQRHGAKVTVQDVSARAYNGEILKGYNIIGSINPDAKARIMLSSHWDSRPYADWDADAANIRKPIPGANDGASGVGVLLEVARILKGQSPAIGIDIVFWDLEDYGEPKDAQGRGKDESWGLGSQFWSRNPHQAAYSAKYGILLDMVGAANATFYMEGFSKKYASSILQMVWNHAQEAGYGDYFINEESNPINDDHIYLNEIAGIPTIDIIHQDRSSQTGFYPYWHTTGDDIDKIDPVTLKVVGQTLLQVIYNEK